MKNPGGMCLCGCGNPTPLSATSRRGYKQGEPLMWIKGHCHRKPGPEYHETPGPLDTPCWVWLKYIGSHGYGRCWDGERVRDAHRVYYERHVGPVPAGLQLDHLCQTRSCCNPAHLEPVTHAENGRRGVHAKLTHNDAHAIRESDEHYSVLARRYGIHPGTVYDVRSGRTWADDHGQVAAK